MHKKFLAKGGASDISFRVSTEIESISASVVVGRMVMMSTVLGDLDFIEELRMRRWARENYVPDGKREASWHPIILDEMDKKDLELSNAEPVPVYA
jgi:hypothetical protein